MWPGLKDQVTEFVRKCDIYQKQKIVRAKFHEPMLITDTLVTSLLSPLLPDASVSQGSVGVGE